MLQQTQVLRVIPQVPRVPRARSRRRRTCAAAPLGDVLRSWQGLGYPRRARNLHAAAAAVVELGAFPDTLDGLLALPGVGPYTAGRVLAFAFEADAAVVDTNIARVYARVARAPARAPRGAGGRRRSRRRGRAVGVEPVDHGARCDRCAGRRRDCDAVPGGAIGVPGGDVAPTIRRSARPASAASRPVSTAAIVRPAAPVALVAVTGGRPAMWPPIVAASSEVAARVVAGLVADRLVVERRRPAALPGLSAHGEPSAPGARSRTRAARSTELRPDQRSGLVDDLAHDLVVRRIPA